MEHSIISKEEKAAIFDRITELEKRSDVFIGEAQTKINEQTDEINKLNKRIEVLEKK